MGFLTVEEEIEKCMEQGRKIRSTWAFHAGRFCKREGLDIKKALEVGDIDTKMQTLSLIRIADALEVLAYGEIKYNE